MTPSNTELVVLVHYTHTNFLFQKISCLVFQEISGTHDGYTYAHFVMTDI